MILLTFNIINAEKKNRESKDDALVAVTENNCRAILRILEYNDTRATFFVEISLVEKMAALLKTIVGKGHEVAFYNECASSQEISDAKGFAEDFLQKLVRGIRQKNAKLSVTELKSLGFSYISDLEYSNVFFPFKRFERSTEILEDRGVSIIPESISPYLQLPYNDLVFQLIPMSYYKNMVFETLKKDDFVLIYLNSWHFTDFSSQKIHVPFYRKYNSGRKMEDKLDEFLKWINENELATSRMKDYLF